MSEPENEKGFSKFAKTLSVILPLITLTSIIFGTVSTITNEFNKIDQIEQSYKVVNDQLGKLSDKIADINTQMVEMKITAARIEERTMPRENFR